LGRREVETYNTKGGKLQEKVGLCPKQTVRTER